MPAPSGTTTPSMSVLRNLEDKIAGLVEGTFGRVFRSQVRPVEIARKLAREMDEHKTVSVSRTYVPNEYVVWLSPEDRQRFEGVEHEVIDELVGLPARARPPREARARQPPADHLRHRRAPAPGRVRHPGAARARGAPRRCEQADHGHTMVYSTAARAQEELAGLAQRARAAARCSWPRASATPSARAARRIGRSRECDIVLADANVSRRHAELRPAGRRLDDHRPGLDQRRARQRARRARQRAARRCSPATGSRSGTVDARFEVD